MPCRQDPAIRQQIKGILQEYHANARQALPHLDQRLQIKVEDSFLRCLNCLRDGGSWPEFHDALAAATEQNKQVLEAVRQACLPGRTVPFPARD